MTIDNFYLQNRLIQASQTGGQCYSDTSPFSIPCIDTCSVVSHWGWWNKESEILNSHLKCFSLEKHIGVRRKEVTMNHATSYKILCEK